MRNRLLLVLLALACTLGLWFGYDRLRPPGVVALPFHLPNGLEADVLSEDCGIDAAVVVALAVGANHDLAGHSGMARLIDRLLAPSGEGEPGRTRVESGADYLVYSVVAPRETILDELQAVAGRLTKLQATEAALGTARAAVIEEIANRSGGDPALTAATYAAESVQQSRGGGRRGGIRREVETVDAAALEAFWRASFTGADTRVVVVGNVDPERARARITEAFSGVPPGPTPALRPPGDTTVTGTLVMGEAPTAVAIAVRSPPVADRTYPPFLLLAARLLAAGADAGWKAAYDPLLDHDLLFITGSVESGEGPEPAAARIRAGVAALVERPLTTDDVANARARFAMFLGDRVLDGPTCRRDPRAVGIAYARRKQLQAEALPLEPELRAATQQGLSEAAGAFAPNRTAAVIAGGAIH